MKWQKEAIRLYGQGIPVRQIATMLGKSYHTVYMCIKRSQERQQKNSKKFEDYYNRLKQSGAVENIINMLMQTVERKGKKIPVSINQVYKGILPYLQLEGITMKKSRFYQFVRYIIIKEFGSIEKFNNTVYNTPTKNRDTKGTVKRLPETIELDATGISWQGKLYFVLLSMDLETGYIFDPYFVESKDTGAKYYNTAINTFDIAKYLRDMFIQNGTPKAIKTDNEETLKSELITRALKQLKIKHIKTKPYNPQQKLIERTIRTIKDYMTLFKDQPFETALKNAIDHYNKEQHKFKEYSHKVVPAELFAGYDHADEDTIRKAFREKFERILGSNMTITINKDEYSVIVQTEKFGLYGREGKLKVIAFRDIDNKTVIDIYTEDGEYIGVGKLISNTNLLDSLSERQEKNRQRRIQKRETKIRQELAEIEASKQSQTEEPQIDLSILQQPATEQEQEEEISVWKILTGGQ